MSAEIEHACVLLRNRELVAFPTETVYGLGAHALDTEAVLEVFETKGRPQFDPLIVHTKDAQAAFALCEDVPPVALELARRFWPGPLTLVLRKTAAVPDLVTSGMPTVAVRVPAHPLALALLNAFDGPIAAPSANRFGRISPTTAQHVINEFGDRVKLVLDGGPCNTGVESTIVSLIGETPLVLRPGGLPLESLRDVLPEIDIAKSDPTAPTAPGQLASHYAPRTPLVLSHAFTRRGHSAARVGLLQIGPAQPAAGFDRVETLSATGDMREAAASLFAAMRRLDEAGLDLIVAELAPSAGLGLAINDRLRRASHRD